MLLTTSVILIFLLTGAVVYYTYTSRKYFTSMTGNMLSMTNAMMSSLTIGTILGIYLPNRDLTLPTIIAVLIGIIVGYITGSPISLMAVVEGLTAGIMGGMMGAMLGVMINPTFADIMVYFIDFLSVLINVLLIQLINEEKKINCRKI